jgi:hypothetical protein
VTQQACLRACVACISDNAGRPKGRHDLDQEGKDQRETEGNIAHLELAAREPSKQLRHGIGRQGTASLTQLGDVS